MPYTRNCASDGQFLGCAQGKYVVLFFYPLDFTFVCPTEITAFSDQHAEFAKINTEVGLLSRFACLTWGSQTTPVWRNNLACAAADPGRLRGLALLPPGLGADRCGQTPCRWPTLHCSVPAIHLTPANTWPTSAESAILWPQTRHAQGSQRMHACVCAQTGTRAAWATWRTRWSPT